jgi:glycosyltransferase involved in cell wall biosynthesis
MSPLPIEPTKKIYGTAIRTWQMAKPLIDDGHELFLVCYSLEGEGSGDKRIRKSEPRKMRSANNEFMQLALDKESFENHVGLKGSVETFAPDAVLGVTFFPSYVAAFLAGERPFWADLFGHVMGEAQAKARSSRDDSSLFHFWNQERKVISRADVFSSVSERQRFALIGELGTIGRLNSSTAGYEFVHPIPCGADFDTSSDPAPRKPVDLDLKTGDFLVLWSGTYNTWVDEETLFNGLEAAMRSDPGLVFVSTGGGVSELGDDTYQRFLERVRSSPYQDRFRMLGWLDREELLWLYNNCHLGINMDKAIYEVELGSKNRIIEWLKYGLPVLSTNVCELTDELASKELCFTFEPGSPSSLANLLFYLSGNRDLLTKTAAKARRYAEVNFSFNQTCRELLKWAAQPTNSPDFGSRNAMLDEASRAFYLQMSTIEDQKRLIAEKDEIIAELRSLLGERLAPRFYAYCKKAIKKFGALWKPKPQ